MLKTISICMITLVIVFESLLPKGMGISEASKIGELYEHFISHQKNGVSLGKFLLMHYASDSAHKSNSEHKKLPSFESQMTVLAFEVLKTISVVNATKINVKHWLSINFKYCNNYKFQFSGAVLNPPRIA